MIKDKLFFALVVMIGMTSMGTTAADPIYPAYVTTGSGDVLQFSAPNTYSVYASGLVNPSGIAVARNGDVYVADQPRNIILKYTAPNTFSIYATVANPGSMALDGSGNLFVTNIWGGTVVKIGPDGASTLYASGLPNPIGLALDADQNVFVSAMGATLGDGKILKFTGANEYSLYASGLIGVRSISIDSLNRVYVAEDVSPGDVRIFTAPDTSTLLASGLYYSFGVYIDPNDLPYVVTASEITTYSAPNNPTAFASGLFYPNNMAWMTRFSGPPVPKDTVSPVTTAITVPTPNGAGWNNSAVTVTLNAADNADGSGVRSITYAVGAGPATTANATTALLLLSAPGITTISYFATDNASNNEAVNTMTLKIDTIPPVLSLPGNITVNATGPAGAVVSYAASATDDSGPPTVACAPLSGSAFPIAVTHVSCTATDVAGNVSTGGFLVTVAGPSVQTSNLISDIQNFGIAQGTANSLISKLQNAVNLINTGSVLNACSVLNAFLNETKAQFGKMLTSAQANQLIAAANQVKSAEACP